MAAVWPEVLAMVHSCNIRNYTVFRCSTLLFAYFEYAGDDFAANMATIAADPKTHEWWTHTNPMQTPVAGSRGRVVGDDEASVSY